MTVARLAVVRGHLNYANVMATIAVFISLGAGAYAIGIGDVRSRHLADGTIKSRDVGDRALFGRDIHDETISTRQVREDRLEASQFARVESGAGSCDPAGPAFVTCASVSVGAEQPSDLLIFGTGGQSGSVALEEVSGRCELAVDGVAIPESFVDPGGTDASHNDASRANGFATTAVAPSASPGSHTVAMRCNETAGDTFIEAKISVLALDAR